MEFGWYKRLSRENLRVAMAEYVGDHAYYFRGRRDATIQFYTEDYSIEVTEGTYEIFRAVMTKEDKQRLEDWKTEIDLIRLAD